MMHSKTVLFAVSVLAALQPPLYVLLVQMGRLRVPNRLFAGRNPDVCGCQTWQL